MIHPLCLHTPHLFGSRDNHTQTIAIWNNKPWHRGWSSNYWIIIKKSIQVQFRGIVATDCIAIAVPFVLLYSSSEALIMTDWWPGNKRKREKWNVCRDKTLRGDQKGVCEWEGGAEHHFNACVRSGNLRRYIFMRRPRMAEDGARVHRTMTYLMPLTLHL